MVRTSLRILGVLAFQCTLIFLLLEGGLRLLRPHLLGLNALLYTPSTQTDYDAINDLPTLMKTSILGFRRGDLSWVFWRRCCRRLQDH